MSQLLNPTDVVGIISQYSRWDGWIAEKTKVLPLPNASAKLSTSHAMIESGKIPRHLTWGGPRPLVKKVVRSCRQ